MMEYIDGKSVAWNAIKERRGFPSYGIPRMKQKEKKYITLQAVDLIAFIMEVYKQLIDDVCH